MQNEETNKSIQKQRNMSFYSFLNDNYELSKFVLPKVKPVNDTLDKEEMNKLTDLIMDKDFYEINSIIRNRYKNN